MSQVEFTINAKEAGFGFPVFPSGELGINVIRDFLNTSTGLPTELTEDGSSMYHSSAIGCVAFHSEKAREWVLDRMPMTDRSLLTTKPPRVS